MASLFFLALFLLYYIAPDDFERRVVVNCLNEMQNSLIANGKYTDPVDEILLKIIDAKQKTATDCRFAAFA